MRVQPLCLVMVLAGCTADTGKSPEPRTTGPTLREEAERELARGILELADLEPGVRDDAEERLVRRGFPAISACREALARSQDAEQADRLRRVLTRIERDDFEKDLELIWRDQWFVILEGGTVVGVEHDRASRTPTWDSPGWPGEVWDFESTVTLKATGTDPQVALDVRAVCRMDGPLSPLRVDWSTIGKSFLFFSTDRSGVPEGMVECRDLLDRRTRVRLKDAGTSISLRINATRLVERAALVERPALTMKLFDCGGPFNGSSAPVTMRLASREAMTWDGEQVLVLKYVDAGAPPETRDEYFVSKERGLMVARIGKHRLVRLRGSPYEVAMPK